MTLRELFSHVPGVAGAAPASLADAEARAVTYDSREAGPGVVFVALRGTRTDGARFAAQALAKGAPAIVAESAAPAGVTAPWLQVENAREALAALAAVLAGDPSEQLALIGITGTNGKTTTSYLLTAMFEAAGTR
ncbi:MAG TPA: Mur ligase domain-containing protein, partial [Vicinamibacterales bacterium]|nr:Mur ligase domain-containing protein [Vicinamibacterales bacterium]